MEYPTNAKSITKAYLVRNNNTLISKMIEYNKSKITYHLSHKTKLDQIFKLPRALIFAKPAFEQKDLELKHLQHDIDDWGSMSAKKREQISLFKYLLQANPEDSRLKSAIQLVINHGPQDILDAYNHAKEQTMVASNLYLLTAHTSKGGTWDIVELDDDLNESIFEAIEAHQTMPTPSTHAELCLGFVAASRHKHQLLNCKFL